ncbi:MFS transporter [Pantoea sp. Ap-967]|uniref:MFS transporter n=1 Tax=Pantoea sp. Ap-967 TaxID=2608362 RepID=UPI00142377CF|nr:MFS transporter [Pantoea sp. Ap-967]NIE72931.1 MFS transporter [Pantoea sp. Ap-967]
MKVDARVNRQWVRHVIPVGACTILGSTGFGAYLALPMILGALSQAKGIDPVKVGWLGSSELVGLLLGCLLTARLLGRGRSHSIALAGAAMAVVANLATAWAEGVGLLIVLRFAAGLGGGMCYAYALSKLSVAGNRAANACVFGIGLGLSSSCLCLTIPWLLGHWGLEAVFVSLATMFVLAAAALNYVPAVPESCNPDNQQGASLNAVGLISIGAVVLWGLATACFWAYTERLGTAQGLTSDTVGQVLNVANLTCMASCLFAYKISKLWGQHLPQVILLFSSGLLCLFWNVEAADYVYAGQVFIYFQMIALTQVLQIVLFGALDESGRLAALLPAAQGVGQAAGPLLGSFVFAYGYGFDGLLSFVGGMFIVSSGLFMVGYLRTQRKVLSPVPVAGA